MTKSHNKKKGKRAERLAHKYLMSKKYYILATNYRFSRLGELDIVCLKDETVVIVEVKFRSNFNKGRPEESITAHKCRQLRKLAHIFIHKHDYRDLSVRFDIITIVSKNLNQTCEMIHYRSAF